MTVERSEIASPARDHDAHVAELCRRLLGAAASVRTSILSDPDVPVAVADEVRRVLRRVDDSRTSPLDRAPPMPSEAIELWTGADSGSDAAGDAAGVPTDASGLSDGHHGGWDSIERLDALVPTGRIDRWTVDEVLGVGGFGVVLGARQASPIERTAAIKLLRPEVADEQARARFESERQVLARLDHPGIARVLEAGVTDASSGRPGIAYVAMDRVDGLPIDAWTTARRPGVPTLVALLIDVCDAIAHAHRRGVVHRDLKPSNILVADRDERPIPVVIDFGLARVRERDDELPDGPTQVIGTPKYMAPEQLLGDARRIDVRTDVYALGVVLGTLLDLVEVSGPPAPRDLRWIAERCRANQPDDRYDGAGELQRDLQRWLDGRPVQARATSILYRIRRHTRRHPLIASALVLSGGAIAVAGVAWRQATQADSARSIAEATSETRQMFLETERARREGFESLVRRIVRAPNSNVAVAGEREDPDVTIKDVLPWVGDAIEEVIGGDPESVDLRLELADALAFTHEYDASLAAVERVDEILAGVSIGDDLRARVEYARATALGALGRAAEADAAYARAIEGAAASGNTVLECEATNGRTYMQWTLGDQAQAWAFARRAVALADRIEDPDQIDPGAGAYNNLASLHRYAGELDEAEAAYRRAIAMRTGTPSESTQSHVIALRNLVLTVRGAQRWDEIIPAAEDSLDAAVRILGETDLQTIGTRIRLAEEYLDVGRLDDAATQLAIAEPNIPAIPVSQRAAHRLEFMLSAARLARQRGDLPGAAAAAQEALDLHADGASSSPGEAHRFGQIAAAEWAEIALARGDVAGARRTLDAAPQGDDAGGHSYGRWLMARALVDAADGDDASAIVRLESAQAVMVSDRPHGHLKTTIERRLAALRAPGEAAVDPPGS